MERIKIVLLFVLAIFLVNCCQTTSVPIKTTNQFTSKSDMVEFLRNSTIAIFEEHKGKRAYQCAGVWISTVRIVTAFHCVDDEKSSTEDLVGSKITFSTYKQSKETHEAKILAVSLGQDLALLEAESGLNHDFVEIEDGLINSGDITHIVGHPAAMLYTYVSGTISQSKFMEMPHKDWGKLLHITAPIWFGNSGGGAFSENGKLIGICSFILRVPETSFYIHRDIIKSFVQNFSE